jgi:hypothetical protein
MPAKTKSEPRPIMEVDGLMGISGQHQIPFRALLKMFGFDPDVCLIILEDNNTLTVEQKGVATTLSIAREFFRYA